MTFIDTYDDREYSLLDMARDYRTFRNEDPVNHAETFTAELFEIIMASVNGRNDLDVIGPTPSEVSRICNSLRMKIERKV